MKRPERTIETALISRQPGAAVKLGLVVFSGDSVSSFPLPELGEVVVGRSREADLHVADESLSRKHAQLRITAAGFEVKDLGSQNGTRINGKSVGAKWTPLELGDALQLGDATAVLQRSAATRPHRRLWSHAYFEVRVEDECAHGAPFAVVRVHLEGKPKDASAAEALSRAIGPADVLASYAPNELEVMLLGVDVPQAQERADALVAALEPQRARTGVACFPRDGRDADRLLSRACAEALDRTERDRGAAGDGKPIIASASMKKLYELVDRIAPSDISVLVLGETGSGKEVVAHAIHQRSARASKPYVAFNCAALAENLLESELFGHEKGAFTGADQPRTGLLESAHGGTVFLDELGELPLTTQVKLLRVLEERAVRKVGGTKTRSIDVRFVAATNRDLEREVREGRFRQDLFYRVAAVTVPVPPLRERHEELELLAKAFITRAGGSGLSLSAAALQQLKAYRWPGNVRELKNVIERAVLLCDGRVIEPDALPLEKLGALLLDATPKPLPELPPLPDGGDAAERGRIVAALSECAGNQTAAARKLGISRRTLLYRLDEYGLPRPLKKSS